jgi:hypothetical protein
LDDHIHSSQKEGIMENMQEVKVEDYTDLCGHIAARPLKYFKDKDGYGWLCDKNINPDRDLRKQGCWRCDEMVFPTGS